MRRNSKDGIRCSVVFELPYSFFNQGYGASVVTFMKAQPLGFDSSCPLFTFTHHMLVWIAAERVPLFSLRFFTDERNENFSHVPGIESIGSWQSIVVCNVEERDLDERGTTGYSSPNDWGA